MSQGDRLALLSDLFDQMMGRGRKGRFKEGITRMEEAIDILQPHEDQEPVKPEEGVTFETFNGSLVQIVKIDNDGDGIAVVLKGGHAIQGVKGQEPGDKYFVDAQGYFKESPISYCTVMSLKEKADNQL